MSEQLSQEELDVLLAQVRRAADDPDDVDESGAERQQKNYHSVVEGVFNGGFPTFYLATHDDVEAKAISRLSVELDELLNPDPAAAAPDPAVIEEKKKLLRQHVVRMQTKTLVDQLAPVKDVLNANEAVAALTTVGARQKRRIKAEFPELLAASLAYAKELIDARTESPVIGARREEVGDDAGAVVEGAEVSPELKLKALLENLTPTAGVKNIVLNPNSKADLNKHANGWTITIYYTTGDPAIDGGYNRFAVGTDGVIYENSTYDLKTGQTEWKISEETYERLLRMLRQNEGAASAATSVGARAPTSPRAPVPPPAAPTPEAPLSGDERAEKALEAQVKKVVDEILKRENITGSANFAKAMTYLAPALQAIDEKNYARLMKVAAAYLRTRLAEQSPAATDTPLGETFDFDGGDEAVSDVAQFGDAFDFDASDPDEPPSPKEVAAASHEDAVSVLHISTKLLPTSKELLNDLLKKFNAETSTNTEILEHVVRTAMPHFPPEFEQPFENLVDIATAPGNDCDGVRFFLKEILEVVRLAKNGLTKNLEQRAERAVSDLQKSTFIRFIKLEVFAVFNKYNQAKPTPDAKKTVEDFEKRIRGAINGVPREEAARYIDEAVAFLAKKLGVKVDGEKSVSLSDLTGWINPEEFYDNLCRVLFKDPTQRPISNPTIPVLPQGHPLIEQTKEIASMYNRFASTPDGYAEAFAHFAKEITEYYIAHIDRVRLSNQVNGQEEYVPNEFVDGIKDTSLLGDTLGECTRYDEHLRANNPARRSVGKDEDLRRLKTPESTYLNILFSGIFKVEGVPYIDYGSSQAEFGRDAELIRKHCARYIRAQYESKEARHSNANLVSNPNLVSKEGAELMTLQGVVVEIYLRKLVQEKYAEFLAASANKKNDISVLHAVEHAIEFEMDANDRELIDKCKYDASIIFQKIRRAGSRGLAANWNPYAEPDPVPEPTALVPEVLDENDMPIARNAPTPVAAPRATSRATPAKKQNTPKQPVRKEGFLRKKWESLKQAWPPPLAAKVLLGLGVISTAAGFLVKNKSEQTDHVGPAPASASAPATPPTAVPTAAPTAAPVQQRNPDAWFADSFDMSVTPDMLVFGPDENYSNYMLKSLDAHKEKFAQATGFPVDKVVAATLTRDNNLVVSLEVTHSSQRYGRQISYVSTEPVSMRSQAPQNLHFARMEGTSYWEKTPARVNTINFNIGADGVSIDQNSITLLDNRFGNCVVSGEQHKGELFALRCSEAGADADDYDRELFKHGPVDISVRGAEVTRTPGSHSANGFVFPSPLKKDPGESAPR